MEGVADAWLLIILAIGLSLWGFYLSVQAVVLIVNVIQGRKNK